MEMEKEVKILNLDDILPNRFQPRIRFNEENIMELAESIKEHGVIQPIVVRKISDKYEIIAGERRYKASVLAGKTTVPAIITNLDDRDSAEIALIENVQREDLTPIEEAISYKKILDMGYLNQSSLAIKLGKTQSTIANKLRLLNLGDDIQEALLEGKISERHARSLLKLDEEKQKNMLNRIITERLTVRKTDEEINRLLQEAGEDAEILNFDEDKEEINNFNLPANPIIEDTNNLQEDQEFKPSFINMNDVEFSIKPAVIEEESKQNTLIHPEQTPNFINIPQAEILENNVNQPINEFKIEELSPQFSKTNEYIDNDFKSNMSTEQINPGFMDINKIENDAKDIFQPVKEINNIDELLVPTLHPELNLEPSTNVDEIKEEIKEEPVQTGGKFFNMFNFNREEDTNPNYVNDFESKEVNMDFNEISPQIPNVFDFKPAPIEPAVEVVEKTNPVVTEIEQKELVEESIQNEEQNKSLSNDINSTIFPSFQNNVFETQITQDLNNIEMPEVEEKQVEEEPFQPQTSSLTLNDEAEFTNFQPFGGQVQSVEEPQTTINPPVVEQSNIFNQNTNPFAFIDEKINSNYDDVKYENKTDLFIQPVINENQEVQGKAAISDLKLAINTIRDCAKTLEKYGFNVDTEELDFENSYKVTFIIDKK
ncbi:MAG: ParB/RepB/Spo0J family partition protein [Bacilli bacterium]